MARPATRFKRPYVATPEDVRIQRDADGETAIIEYVEEGVMRVHLRLGPEIARMTEEEILDRHNDVLLVQAQMRADNEHLPVEVPVGRPQIAYSESTDTWVPRGSVVRVIVDDDMETGGPAFVVDDVELTVAEFARMLHVWNGWGLRITAVPEDEVHVNPPVDVRDPGDDDW